MIIVTLLKNIEKIIVFIFFVVYRIISIYGI